MSARVKGLKSRIMEKSSGQSVCTFCFLGNLPIIISFCHINIKKEIKERLLRERLFIV